MTRLIDANALTDKVDKYIYRITRASNRKLKVGESAILADIKAHIELSPTIEAEPVRHGKWIWNDKCKRVCSVCENPVAFMLSKDGWHEGRYCPNCGARMRED